MTKSTTQPTEEKQNVSYTEGFLNYLILDPDGRVLHLGLSTNNKKALLYSIEEDEKKNENSHAYIAYDGIFIDERNPKEKEYRCQVIAMLPMKGKESAHGGIPMFLKKELKNIKGLSITSEITPTACLYSGECRSSLTKDKLEKLAINREVLSGVTFTLRGSRTGTLYRTLWNEKTMDTLRPTSKLRDLIKDIKLGEELFETYENSENVDVIVSGFEKEKANRKVDPPIDEKVPCYRTAAEQAKGDSKQVLVSFIPIENFKLNYDSYDAGIKITAPGLDSSTPDTEYSIKDRIKKFEEEYSKIALPKPKPKP